MGEYFLLFKTAQAEFRCWRHFNHPNKALITPVVELTRGRKKPKVGAGLTDFELFTTQGIYDIEKNISDAVASFRSSNRFILDVTRELSLSCAELNELTSDKDGYQSWVNFCTNLKNTEGLDFIPTIVIAPSEGKSHSEYVDDLVNQFTSLSSHFDNICYRASLLNDSDFIYDLEILGPSITGLIMDGGQFILILDHEFISTGTGLVHALRTSSIVKRVQERFPGIKIVVMGTSFPSTVTELGGEDSGNFPTEEAYLYEEVIRQINDNEFLYYGDYGSINPVRNDRIIIRGGWRPRIDYTTDQRQIYYYREKRGGLSYADHYASVARSVKKNSAFDPMMHSWGNDQILAAAAGRVPASTPSFWISVRMEIFLHRQIFRVLS